MNQNGRALPIGFSFRGVVILGILLVDFGFSCVFPAFVVVFSASVVALTVKLIKLQNNIKIWNQKEIFSLFYYIDSQ